MKGVRWRGDGGFTLLETIIVIVLLGVVGLSFAYLYSSSQRFMIQGVNAASSQTDASFALEHIKRKLTPAIKVIRPAVGGNMDTVLEFEWQQDAGSPVKTSRYVLNVPDLQFIPDTAAPGAFEVVAHGIQSINFHRATAAIISIDVTAQRTSGGDTRTMHLQTNVSPRGLSQ